MPSLPARKAVSRSGIGLLLAATLTPGLGTAQVPAQSAGAGTPAAQGSFSTALPSRPAAPLSHPPYPGMDTPQPARVLHFTKPPNSSLVPQPAPGNPPLGRARPSPPRTDPVLRPAAFQAQPRDLATATGEEAQLYEVQLEPPGPLRLFRLESEQALQERIRQEVRDRTPPGATPERTVFPEEPVISRQPYQGRSFPPANLVVEPSYLCYDRLYFEQKNFERYGWDLGPITPFLSATGFFWDVVTLPYHLATAPCRRYECSAGYCLPGSPMPLLLYPPELSLTGLVAEAGTITALFAMFP